MAGVSDRVAVGLQIAVRIGLGQRGLAEHVEGIAVGRVGALARARQRLADRAAHDELVAHDPHRLAHRQPDHRLADAADQALERVVDVALGVVRQVDQMPGQHQAPGGGVDQHRVRLAHVLLPVGLAELVADQRIGRVLVRNAQQRLGHAHQQHAFLAAEVVLLHEGLDRALVLRARADPAHQIGRGGLDRGAVGLAPVGAGLARLAEEITHMGAFVPGPCRGDGRAQRRKGGRLGGGRRAGVQEEATGSDRSGILARASRSDCAARGVCRAVRRGPAPASPPMARCSTDLSRGRGAMRLAPAVRRQLPFIGYSQYAAAPAYAASGLVPGMDRTRSRQTTPAQAWGPM